MKLTKKQLVLVLCVAATAHSCGVDELDRIDQTEHHLTANDATGMICGWGVADCNRCVYSVENALAAANTSSAGEFHGRLGKQANSTYRNDQLNHHQGMGRLYHPDGRFVVLGRSMEGSGQLLMFRLGGYPSTQGAFGSSGSHSLSNTVVWQFNDEYDRNHPDGLSVMGSYFVHGISCEGGGKCNRDQDMPKVYVWNAGNPYNPFRTLVFDLANWPGYPAPNDTASAGAATMVKLANGRYLLIVKSKQYINGDRKRVVSFFQGSSLNSLSSWTMVDVLPDSEINSFNGETVWNDVSHNFQHITAVTECGTGTIYLVATKGHGHGDPVKCHGCSDNSSEVVRLFRLGIGPTGYTLTKRGHRYFHCSDGVAFGGAGSVYATSNGKMSFYTGQKCTHDTSTGVKIKFREFWSP